MFRQQDISNTYAGFVCYFQLSDVFHCYSCNLPKKSKRKAEPCELGWGKHLLERTDVGYSYTCQTRSMWTAVNHKIMDASSFLMALLLCVLLQETALGSAATQIYMETTGVCVAPGDALELYCTLRSASRKETQVSFGKESTPIDDTSHTQILAFTPMCRQIDSDYKWDLKVRLTVHAASVNDEGVYWCRAVENGRTYTSSATVFVQRQSEFELATNLTANLGEFVTVQLDRKCDHKAPVRVTRTSRDGMVEELPYRYSHEGYQSAYVDKLDGALVIPVFSCTNVGKYTVTVMAPRGFEPVSTSKSIDIKASCEGCCPEDAPVTPASKTNEPDDTFRKSTAEPGSRQSQSLDTENRPNERVFIAFIVILAIWGIAGPFLVYFWHRRKIRDLPRGNQTQVDVEGEAVVPLNGTIARVKNRTGGNE